MEKNSNNEFPTKKFIKAADKVSKDITLRKPGYIVADGDERILMPMQVALMQTDMSKIQQNIVIAILEGMKDTLRTMLDFRLNGVKFENIADKEIPNDKHPIKLSIPFKNFGVSPKHYPQLAQAMQAMSKVPVSIPFTSPTGIEYTRSSSLCYVYLPKEKSKQRYCIVSMDEDTAAYLLKFDLGYLYVGRMTALGMSTKYSSRLYWYVKGNLNRGWSEIKTGSLRKMLGAEGKLQRFAAFETKILAPAAAEMKKLFEERKCECWFKYDKIYKKGAKEEGEPEKIRFTVYYDKKMLEEKLADEAENNRIADAVLARQKPKPEDIPGNQREAMYTLMTGELHMPDGIAKAMAGRITPDNYGRALSKAISLKERYDDNLRSAKIVDWTAYLIKAWNSFFEDDGAKPVPLPQKPVISLTHAEAFKRWQKAVVDVCSVMSEDMIRETVALASFERFQDGVLLIRVPSRDVYECMEKFVAKKLMTSLQKNFGDGVRLSYRIAPTA